MAGMNGLSGSTNASLSGLKGYGGLVSGLDRDSLIEGMTSGTRAKIAQQLQKKQILQWEQDGYRGISSKMVELSQKYMSYSSSTNLSSSSFFARSSITALGENSKYVEVSGAAAGADLLSIVGVKKLATDANATTKAEASNQVLTTGLMNQNFADIIKNSSIEGSSIDIKYGNKEYTVMLPAGDPYDYSDETKTAASINEALKNVDIGGGRKLSEAMKVEVTGNKFTLTSTDTEGYTIQLAGGTNNVLESLGFLGKGETIESLDETGKTITTTGLTGKENAVLFRETSLAKRLGGKTINFTYNGVTKSITLPEEAELNKGVDSLKSLQDNIQKQLDKEFGKNRIEVGLTSGTGTDISMGKLEFKTVLPNKQIDKSSTLTVSGADAGLLGEHGAFKMELGESNRVNMNTALWKAGVTGLQTLPIGKKPGDPFDITINDTKIEGLTYESTISEIMNKINTTEGAGVTVSYMENADKFVIKAKAQGASGKIQLNESAKMLFGDCTIRDGQDASIMVKYAGSDTETEVVRGSNTFVLDKLNITVKGEFGYKPIVDSNGTITGYDKIPNSDPIRFDAKTDTDKILKAAQDFVKDYNELLSLVNTEVRTKPDRDYAPLTAEQKKELSEDQIKTWEEKAKKGRLFNDSTLRNVADDLRFMISTGSNDKKILEQAGISISTDYSDNGKLILNETKFKAALESNPEAVKNVFTRPKDEKTGAAGGLMVKMKALTDQYASTTGMTKGALIEHAGSTYAPNSVLKNALLTEMNSIDDVVERLNDKLATEQDRYIKQFTSLETLISQMNSQSSWLSQQFGA